jgi:ribosomal-protein-alanine N-acetyltransferase
LTITLESGDVTDSCGGESDRERSDGAGREEATVAAPDVTVRPADRADLIDVLRIERASFSEPWPYAAFESLLDAPAFLVAVGEAGRCEAWKE